jgi:uncharacterized protein (TIGR02246 family)
MKAGMVAIVAALLTAGLPYTPALTAPAAVETPNAADRAQVEKLVYDFESAWNRHDMTAFAALFHDDAEWIHWRGGLWSRKKEIHDGHKAVHETYYKTSQADVQGIEALHFLAPAIAYVRVRSDMTGDARYPGEKFRYRRTMLLSKRDGQWLIIKGHNTRIVGDTGVDWKPTRG